MIRAVALAWAERVMTSRPPDFIIGPEAQPYMLRWHIWRTPLIALYLHKFLQDDDPGALHDHPYENLSWVLSGGYWEHTSNGRLRKRAAGSLVPRLAHWPHRVELIRDLTVELAPMIYTVAARPAISLFLCGPRRRHWGFHCPRGWVHWQQYVASRSGGNSRGQGCL